MQRILLFIAIPIMAFLVMATAHVIRDTGPDPLTLSSTVGDTIYLPCLNAPDDVIPVWKINGKLYSATSIHNFFEDVSYRGQGLLFLQVQVNHAGDFICYERVEDGYQLNEIITIHLEIKESQPLG